MTNMDKYNDIDKAISKEIMPKFKGIVVDSICPDCKGEITPNVGDSVLWQYTHHLNSRQTTEIVKEGVLLRIATKRKKYTADYPSKIGVVKFTGNKTNSRVPLHLLYKKDKCQQCGGSGHYKIEY